MLKVRKKKSETLAELIRKNLQEFPFTAGTPVASSREIARKYNVSLSTADQALNHLVQEDFLYRSPGSGTFLKQDSQARSLHIGIADQIVSAQYLTPEINRILDRHFEIAGQELSDLGCHLDLLSYQSMIQSFQECSLDGLLMSINYIDPESVRLMQEKKIPVVVYRHFQSVPEYSCVYYDYSVGMKSALEYLKIRKDEPVVLVYETTSCGRYIHSLWKELLYSYGISEKNIISYDVCVKERDLTCYRLARVNLSKFKGAAILTSNDGLAANLINALTLENLVCGQDYRIIGTENREAYGFEMGNRGPVIASIHTPIEVMAKEAVKLLLYKINHEVDYTCQLRIPTGFVPRLSSGHK